MLCGCLCARRHEFEAVSSFGVYTGGLSVELDTGQSDGHFVDVSAVPRRRVRK
jgi:hypothetical protein